MNELDLSKKNIKELEKELISIKNKKKFKKLYLNDNKIRSLPNDLSIFSNLEYIDLTNNPIININLIIKGLISLPKLKEISINSIEINTDLIEFLISKLNKLEYVNNNKVGNKKSFNVKKDYKNNINQKNENKKEINEEIQLLFQCINQLYNEKRENINIEDFDLNLKTKIKNYVKYIQKDTSFEILKSINNFSQIDIINFVLKKLSNYFTSFGDKRISNILELCIKLFENNLNSIFQLLLNNNNNFLNNFDNNYCLFDNKKIEISNCHERLYNLSKYKKDSEIIESSIKKSFDIKPFNNLTNIKNLNKNDKKEKLLSIKLLKEYINEIYDQKIIYDQKHIEAKLPRETMEQFLHQYLKNKFGLKNLIKENLIIFINSIEKYSNSDIDIKIFGLVLSNKLDEEFRFCIDKIKNSLKSLLKININGKFKNETTKKKNKIFEDKINNYLEYEESLEIINYIYSKEDCDNLSKIIKNEYENINLVKNDRRYLNNNNKNKLIIKYKNYENIIINYFLQKHYSFLEPFNNLFNCYDSDEDGILTEEEFLNLINNVKFSDTFKIDTKKILYFWDPYNNKIINYSSLVTILSDIMLDDNEQYTIMHYIYENFK